MTFRTIVFLAGLLLFGLLPCRLGADVFTDLTAHWALDETTASSGSPVANLRGPDGENGAVNNPASGQSYGYTLVGQPGRVGTAYEFNGPEDVIGTNLDDIIPATGNFSLFGWIQTSQSSGQGYIFNNYVSGDVGRSALQVNGGKL